MTLISRILGFVRDAVIARLFGAGSIRTPFSSPSAFRTCCGGCSPKVHLPGFVPILAEYGRARAKRRRALVDRTARSCPWRCSRCLPWGSPPLGDRLRGAPGFAAEPAKFDVTVPCCGSRFRTSVHIAGLARRRHPQYLEPLRHPGLHRRSSTSASSCAHCSRPLFRSAGDGACLGGVSRGVLQLALQVPALAAIGMLPRPSMAFNDPGVRRVLGLMAPAVDGRVGEPDQPAHQHHIRLVSGVRQRVLALLRGPADGVPPACLVCLGTSSCQSGQYHSEAAPTSIAPARLGLRLTLMLGCPPRRLAVLGVPLVTTLFHYGEFAARDVWMTRRRSRVQRGLLV